MLNFCRRWASDYRERKHYATTKRAPFFTVAGEALPPHRDAVVVDVGCGQGDFAASQGLAGRFDQVYLLDADPQVITGLKGTFPGALVYRAPDRLPFEDGSVDYLHCSHLIEHLTFAALHRFLEEMDRVLKPAGHLVISSPLLWDGFYGDIDHVRPYEPGAIMKHFCDADGWVATGAISRTYVHERTVFRYYARPDSGLGSEKAVIDFFIYAAKAIAWRLGVRRYIRSGYTLVLRKGNPLDFNT